MMMMVTFRHSPTLSASLEYFKYAGAKQLPTQFVSALLDYWEGQGFELKNPKEGRKGAYFSFFSFLLWLLFTFLFVVRCFLFVVVVGGFGW